MLNDVSSEVTIRTLPLFLANVLGVRTVTIGMIEGIGESVSTLLKTASGSLADRLGRKKPLALAGYALSGFSKPLLYFATGWGWVLVVRVLDRIGKGVRTPPRDALIADLTPAGQRGQAFGFNKAMDKAGSVAGLLAAAGTLYAVQHGAARLTRTGLQSLVLLAVLPGIASVLVLARWVKEPAARRGLGAEQAGGMEGGPGRAGATGAAGAPLASPGAAGTPLAAPGILHARFWLYLAILVIFSLGNSSDAFLMLRAQTLGISTFALFLITAGFSAVIALSSTPGGALSDVLGRKRMIVAGWLIYAAIYIGFAFASRAWHVAVLYAGYGLYYGAFQGASTALVADIVPLERRGTAFGLFNAALGIAALPASAVAGWMWQRYGVPAPFLLGGALALVASLALAALPLPEAAGADEEAFARRGR